MQKLKTYFNKLKAKWGIKRDIDVILILVAFAITGSLVLKVANWIFYALGFDDQTSLWIKILVRVVLIFPIYQVLLLIIGSLLGQHYFFWGKMKKMSKWLTRPFRKKEG